MGCVSIIKIKSVKESVHQAVELIGGIESIFQTGDIVMIKPNLNDFISFTSPEITAAMIELLFDYNIKDVFIAESTFGNAAMTAKHFKETGYLNLAKCYDIDIVNINGSVPVEKKVKDPLVLDTIKIGRDTERATKIVNIPVMKVHYATGVTLCLKNLKGLLCAEEKIHFHETGLEKAIVDLNNTIPVDLNLLDGTSCMESMGPKGGDIFHLGLLLAGKNPGEVDYIASRIMGFEETEIIHLHRYLVRHNIDVNSITTCGEEIETVYRPFKKAEVRMPHPENIAIHNTNACSSCVNALLLSLGLLGKTINNETMTDPFHIYLGKKHDDAETPAQSISFGNCCKKTDTAITIKGCPPYPFTLKQEIEKYFRE